MTFTRGQMLSFLYAQALIWLPLIAGHRLRRMGWLSDEIAKPFQRVNLIVFCPIVYGLGIWRLPSGNHDWLIVPSVMAASLMVITILGVLIAPRLGRSRPTVGTLAIMVPLSNNGHTLAGFLTIFLYDTLAYGYNAILMVPTVLYMVLIWIPLARHWSSVGGDTFMHSLRRVVFSAEGLPLIGIAAGILLRWKGPPMSTAWNDFLRWAVFGSTAITMFAMGCRIYIRRLLGYGQMLKWVYLVKFVVWPALMIGLCLATGLSGPAAGALFIASCMPVGVMVVGISTIYDLDIDLANAGFILSTFLFMTLILPILIYIVQWPYFR